MPVHKRVNYNIISRIAVRYVQGSLPAGEFVGGLPSDGSIINAPAVQAEAWIAAGIAERVNNAALAAQADDKEND
jgi:hypothetical protein